MKQTFNIIKLGLRNARFYIESFNLKWRHLFVISLLATVMMAVTSYRTLQPIYETFNEDITGSLDYIPDYSYRFNGLELKDGEKPLYYQATYFQLVIDDSIESDGRVQSIRLPRDKAANLSQNTVFGLYLFRDQALIKLAGEVTDITSLRGGFASDENLKQVLNLQASQSKRFIVGIIIACFIQATLGYWLIILIISFLAGFYNVFLTQRINFRQRMKMAVIVSFVPILLAELLNLLFRRPLISSSLVIVLSLVLIYQSFRNHTRFIQNLMRQIDPKDK